MSERLYAGAMSAAGAPQAGTFLPAPSKQRKTHFVAFASSYSTIYIHVYVYMCVCVCVCVCREREGILVGFDD